MIEIRNMSPKDQSQNIPINSRIKFDIVALNGCQIDIDSLNIEIETNSKIIDGEIGILTYGGDSNHLTKGPIDIL